MSEEITRRDFGRGLAAIIAAGTAPSIVLRCEAHNAGLLRGVGARNAMMGGGGGWANPYVTDGLFAMWDCEYGVSANGWLDATDNGHDMAFVGSVDTSDPSFVRINGASGAAGVVNSVVLSRPTTQEMVLTPRSCTGYARYFGHRSSQCTYNTARPFGWTTAFGLDASYLPGSAVWGSKVSRTTLYPLSYGEYTDEFENGNKIGNGFLFNFPQLNYESPLYIMNNPSLNRGVTADICCLRIYDRCLSREEIAFNYAVDHERFGV